MSGWLAITAANAAGTPTEATCEHCGAEWRRPPLDTDAESLVRFAWAHRHEDRP